MMGARFIYITGCDGTGKSTQAGLLLARLREQGMAPRHLWLRFPFALVTPLLAYARWRGLSWYESVGGVRQGYWDFRESALLRMLFPWLLLIDATVAAAVRVYLPLLLGRTMVCERFVLDMLVDLEVALSDPGLHTRLPGSLYPRLVPRRARVVVLDANLDTLRARRDDLAVDRRLEERLGAFRRLARDKSLAILSGEEPPASVADRIWHLVAERAGEGVAGSEGVLAATGGLRRMPWMLLLRHWLVQGLAYMDPTERWVKLGLDLLLTGVGGLLLSRWASPAVAWLLAFLVAHTCNYLANAQMPVVLAKAGIIRRAPDEFRAFALELARMGADHPSIEQIVLCGSSGKGGWATMSDLDVRIIRRPGVWNGLRATLFLLRARTRALRSLLPLDAYVLDSHASVARHILPSESLSLLLAASRASEGAAGEGADG